MRQMQMVVSTTNRIPLLTLHAQQRTGRINEMAPKEMSSFFATAMIKWQNVRYQ
jgi:hypothetical protein